MNPEQIVEINLIAIDIELIHYRLTCNSILIEIDWDEIKSISIEAKFVSIRLIDIKLIWYLINSIEFRLFCEKLCFAWILVE